MTTDTILIEKREELKRRLATGEFKTLVDVFIIWINRMFQRVSKQSKPLPLWFVTVFVSVVIDLIYWGVIYAAGDLSNVRRIAEKLDIGYGLGYGSGIFLMSLVSLIAVATILVINQSIHRVIVLWRDDILDLTESVKSLQEFEDWLEKVRNLRQHFLAIVFVGMLTCVGMTITTTSLLGTFPGYGYTFAIFIPNILGATFFTQFSLVILLPGLLRRYELKLFAADPATSELISRLSSELSFIVYFIAFYSTFLTLLSGIAGTYLTTAIAFDIFLWLLIIATFVMNQISLSSLVRRAKWKTLNAIQAKVENLQAAENLESKEAMDAINRLLDYHERVNKTRNSALDLRAYLNFINSLLLPLLAFLLGNLDKVLLLFAGKP